MMIQVKNKTYFISELLVQEVFKDKDKYFMRLTTEEVQEIDDICNNHSFCENCPFEAKDHSCYVLDKELWGDLEIEIWEENGQWITIIWQNTSY